MELGPWDASKHPGLKGKEGDPPGVLRDGRNGCVPPPMHPCLVMSMAKAAVLLGTKHGHEASHSTVEHLHHRLLYVCASLSQISTGSGACTSKRRPQASSLGCASRAQALTPTTPRPPKR